MRVELSEGEEKVDVGGLESLVEGEGKGTRLLGDKDGKTVGGALLPLTELTA